MIMMMMMMMKMMMMMVMIVMVMMRMMMMIHMGCTVFNIPSSEDDLVKEGSIFHKFLST